MEYETTERIVPEQNCTWTEFDICYIFTVMFLYTNSTSYCIFKLSAKLKRIDIGNCPNEWEHISVPQLNNIYIFKKRKKGRSTLYSFYKENYF